MSLFDLQDVCIAIGSLATLDLPMVVDLIGIYGLKGPYCTLTTTNWFLQALSEIPMGSWHDVARRFTMIRWDGRPPPPLAHAAVDPPKRRRRPSPLAVFYVIGLVSITATRRNLPPPTVKCRFPRETGRSQAPRRQQGNNQRPPYEWFVDLFYCIERFPVLILNFRCAAGRRDPDPPPLSNTSNTIVNII
ncbi:hypothetical protein F511_08698 [Dorcoceras hygrometricum]|uniref:Acyl-CoA dehydrogenase-related protein n=1 Tax=Dorcoceras hygrometricum TaxID=472368 RepID=A0A2Z7BNI7_9LAMI|nr:hypothetical protein F511_08698 [Dorcoceras hygrometricum]